MKRIRAGIIGVGNIGAAHMEAIRRLGYADVAAIAVRDEGRAKELCDYFGIPRYYSDYRELLADPGIDVVHDCTPNMAHFQINKDSILAGKHILSEKPLTTDAQESGELVGLAEKHRVVNSVNFVYRHYSMIQRIKAMIEGGELGDIYAIHGSYLQDWLLRDSDYNWRVEARLGGPSRAMADIGSHWCDLAQFLVGSDIVEVCADLAIFVPERMAHVSVDPPVIRKVTIDTEDYGSVLLRFKNGVHGSFTVSQVSAGRKLGLSLEIDGSKASVAWDHDNADRIWMGHRDRPNEVLTIQAGKSGERWPEAQKNMIDSCYRTILHGDRPLFADFKEGHKIVMVVEAILASNKRRAWQSIS